MKFDATLVQELKSEELPMISGGDAVGILGALAVGTLCGGLVLIPLAAAAYKGWLDYN